MAFTELPDLDCEKTTALGGKDKKSGKPNPTSIEGYFIGSKQVASKKSKTGFAFLHVFQTEKGNIGVWGKTNLDRQMKRVTPGFMTRVRFVGMVETDNNPMYKYKVGVDPDNTIDVGSVQQDAEGQEASTEDVGADYAEEAADSAYDVEEESDLSEEDDQALDTAPPARATPPKRPATTPSAERQAKVQALLNGRGKAAS